MQKFAVIGMPRTGSTLLLTGLAQHPEITAFGELFHPVQGERAGPHAIMRNGKKEYFDPECDDAISFLNDCVFPAARQGTSAVGFKLFGEFVRCRGTDKLFQRLKTEYLDMRIIHIVRPNYLDVLTSREVAKQTNRWVEYVGAGQDRGKDDVRVRISPSTAITFFSNMKQIDNFFQSFFAGSNYIKVNYSDLANDFTGTMKIIYKFLGVSDFEPTEKIRKQLSRSPSALIENFGDLRRMFEQTEFGGFFRSGRSYISFPSHNEMRIGEFTFDLDASMAVQRKHSLGRHFVMMKNHRLIEEYCKIIDVLAPANFVELGIRRGGSMAFFNLAFSPNVHVALELEREPIPALENIIELAERDGRRMRPVFGIDQGDKERVLQVIAEEFGDRARPLDMIIDDASHKLDLSTASFETLFPLLREGGIYAIEDWGWAHWPEFQGEKSYFATEPALTNLIFQLIILHSCNKKIIKRIIVTPVIVFVERGEEELDPYRFRIKDNIVMRGKTLVEI